MAKLLIVFIHIPRAKKIIAKSSTSTSVGPDVGLRKMVRPKMDLGKALATMGFGTARKIDASGEHGAQDELNNALTRLMDAHEKKKKKILETEKVEERRKQAADKLRDEVRTIHEAYQFLSKKYKYDNQRLKEKQQIPDSLINIMDEETKEDEVFGLGQAVVLKTAATKWRKGKIEDTEEVIENNTSANEGFEKDAPN